MKEPAASMNLRTFAVEEWHKIPTENCQHLVETYKNRLSVVIAVKRRYIKTPKRTRNRAKQTRQVNGTELNSNETAVVRGPGMGVL